MSPALLLNVVRDADTDPRTLSEASVTQYLYERPVADRLADLAQLTEAERATTGPLTGGKAGNSLGTPSATLTASPLSCATSPTCRRTDHSGPACSYGATRNIRMRIDIGRTV